MMSPCGSATRRSIYQAVYAESRGALKRDLVACLHALFAAKEETFMTSRPT
jgi:hypothetical protein